jgi:hypothetical protein
MFRFDGEVFLFGTAIAAPLKINKNCDDLRQSQRGQTRGGGRIVANRGPYSESGRERKRRSGWQPDCGPAGGPF